MTPEQAAALLALTQTLTDAVMFAGGIGAACIFACTWKG